MFSNSPAAPVYSASSVKSHREATSCDVLTYVTSAATRLSRSVRRGRGPFSIPKTIDVYIKAARTDFPREDSGSFYDSMWQWNFVGAERELREALASLDHNKIGTENNCFSTHLPDPITVAFGSASWSAGFEVLFLISSVWRIKHFTLFYAKWNPYEWSNEQPITQLSDDPMTLRH